MECYMQGYTAHLDATSFRLKSRRIYFNKMLLSMGTFDKKFIVK